MSPRALLISVLLFASITRGRPLVSPRDDGQQRQVVPFTGINSSDPRTAHSPGSLRPAMAAIAMIIAAEQPEGQDALGTILIPYEHPNITPTASTLSFYRVARRSPTPILRTSENTPDVTPVTQSNHSQLLVFVITASTVLGLFLVFTVGKYALGYLRKEKLKSCRFSQESLVQKETVLTPISPRVAMPDADAEAQSLKAFSFPCRPSYKVVRPQDSDEVPSEPSDGNRFSTPIASAAFRKSYLDYDSITTQDAISTIPYLSKVPPHARRDHLRTRSAPVVTDDSSIARPTQSTESVARSYRTSQASVDIPSSFRPYRQSRLCIVQTGW
jgi:hypothetical protein